MTHRRQDSRRGGRLRGDAGASQVIGILATALLVTGILALALNVPRSVDPWAEGDAAAASATAWNALLALLESPGFPESWHEDGLQVTRLGLALVDDSGAPRLVDPAKLAALREPGAFTAGDVARLLDVTDHRVRLTVTPALVPMANGTLHELAAQRTAYVAHYVGVTESAAAAAERDAITEAAAAFHPSPAGAVDNRGVGDRHPDDAEGLRRELVLRLAGFEAAAYSGDTEPAPSAWTVLRKDAHAEAVPAAAAWWAPILEERVLTPAKWSGDSVKGFTLTGGRVHSLTVGSFDLAAFADGDASLEFTHWLAPGEQTPVPDEASVIARCLTCAAPVDVTVWSHASATELGAKGAFERETIDLGDYTGETVLLRLVYARNTIGQGVHVDGEGWFVSSIHVNATADALLPPAEWDVVYANRLDYSTSRYDAVVVGSDVLHSALAGSERVPRAALHDWVDAGGRLLVLGSDHAVTGDWLAPTLAESGSPHDVRGFLADDHELAHPLVRSPHVLAVADHNYSRFAYRAPDDAVRVLSGAGSPTAVPLATATGPTSSFGGVLVLTAARPGLFDDGAETFRALVNWLGFLATAEAHVTIGDAPSGNMAVRASMAATLEGSGARGRVPIEVGMHVWE